MFTNKELVENIRELAKEKGTSLTDMEKKFVWSNGRIGKWKNAKKRPPKQDLELIAKELEVPLEAITGEQKNTAPISEGGKSEILFIFDSLSPDRRAKLLELARLYLADQRKNEESK